MDSRELIERSNEERKKIFDRYELGREGAIDPWEDPEYNVYSMIDRFGFIHDQKIQSPEDDKKTLEKKLEVLAQREKKWVKMLSKWDSKSTKEKLQTRIYKGIPDKVRAFVWTKLLNLTEVMSDKGNKYQEMLELAKHHSTEARQIDSDVNRQFRENIFFRERYNQRQRSLFNVLVAYSMYNMEVSYCQGMSTLAGMLLMYLGEEETFWALNILLTEKKFAMHGLFILGFPKLTRFLAHHDKILTKFLPKLKRHFDQCNLDSILYSLKWFFVIFCERIPFSLCLRVWDVYLLEGEKVSTAMAYTVLKLHKNKLMKLKDLDSIVHFLQVQLPKNFGYDDDFVIKALEQCSEELRKAKMDLPPPPSDNEFPQRQFGVFVEPTKDEKIGHRKSGFTEIEKEVTENVIKTQEEIAAELEKESQLTEVGLGESNSQLNTVQIPESEDGGSLNLSKRSLADTSVTSTADLSIFSGGDRRPASQQHHHYEIENSLLANEKLHCSSDIDLHNFVGVGEDEENGESSPNSIAKSSSTIQIYQKSETVKAEIASLPLNDARADNSNNSNSNDTPTPTISQQDAINPDIVRIYVPPADDMIPDKMLLYHRDRNDDEISQCSNRSSIVHVEYETLPYDKSPDHHQMSPNLKLSPTKSNGTYQPPKSNSKMSPGATTTNNNNNNNKNSPQQYYYYPHQPASTATMNSQSSSSRRGSMSRKTPSPLIESDVMIECDHMRFRKSQENINDIDQQPNSLNYSINGSTTSSNNKYTINNIIGSPIKRLTSFEELAKKSESNSLLYIHETISDNNNYRNNYPPSNSKPKSDYNICYNYKNLDNPNEDLDYSSMKHQLLIKKSTSHSNNFRRNERSKHSSSENSPFDYDILKEKRKENRFMYDDESSGRQLENNDNSIKSYDRFFNSDDEIDDEYDSRPNHRVNKKSSSSSHTHHKYRVPHHVSGTEADEDDENSSNSPPNKSILNTPMNECIPLLSCDAEQTVIYQSPIPPIPILPPTSSISSNTSSLTKQQPNRSKIPLRVGNHNNNNSNNNSPLRKNSSISSPDSDRSDGYQTSINRYDNRIAQSMAYQSSPTPSSTSSNYRSAIGTPTTNTSSSTQRSDNKIRIKIKQNH